IAGASQLVARYHVFDVIPIFFVLSLSLGYSDVAHALFRAASRLSWNRFQHRAATVRERTQVPERDLGPLPQGRGSALGRPAFPYSVVRHSSCLLVSAPAGQQQKGRDESRPGMLKRAPRQAAEERAVAYLVREVPLWSQENHCFSCHNNGDGARAL